MMRQTVNAQNSSMGSRRYFYHVTFPETIYEYFTFYPPLCALALLHWDSYWKLETNQPSLPKNDAAVQLNFNHKYIAVGKENATGLCFL